MSGDKESPSQTAGPYVHIGCLPKFAGLDDVYQDNDLGAVVFESSAPGERIELLCCIFDGDNETLTDAMVEIWQADANGKFDPAGCQGWGRRAWDHEACGFVFETVKPGAVAEQAPHIVIWIVARGINLGLTTRLYFPDEDNMNDPIYQLAGSRADTMLAQRIVGGYSLNIFLQGPNETVFFDV